MPWRHFLIGLTCLIGVGVMLYPTVAAWITQYYQSQLIVDYSSRVVQIPPEGRAAAIRQAEAYNAALTGGAELAANERLPLSGRADSGSDYHQTQLADENGLMARIRIPRIDVDLPIYHGTTDEVLRNGVGHLEGTALPVGGPTTHAVLTAHRGLAGAELFDNLDKVEPGDTFTVEVFGEVLTYRVVDTRVVAPEETETLYPWAGHDLVTLVTCTPLGINSHRILVTGERVLPTPVGDVESAGKHPTVPKFPWWAVLIGGTAAAVGGYVYLAGRPPRHTARRAES